MNKWYREINVTENGYYVASNILNNDLVNFKFEWCVYDTNGMLLDTITQDPIYYRGENFKHWFLYFGMNGIVHTAWDREANYEIYYYIRYDEDE